MGAPPKSIGPVVRVHETGLKILAQRYGKGMAGLGKHGNFSQFVVPLERIRLTKDKRRQMIRGWDMLGVEPAGSRHWALHLWGVSFRLA